MNIIQDSQIGHTSNNHTFCNVNSVPMELYMYVMQKSAVTPWHNKPIHTSVD